MLQTDYTRARDLEQPLLHIQLDAAAGLYKNITNSYVPNVICSPRPTGIFLLQAPHEQALVKPNSVTACWEHIVFDSSSQLSDLCPGICQKAQKSTMHEQRWIVCHPLLGRHLTASWLGCCPGIQSGRRLEDEQHKGAQSE